MAKDVWWLRNLSALPIKVQLCCIKPLAKFNFQETWALSSFKTFLGLSTCTAEQFHCRLPVSLGAYRVSLLLGTWHKQIFVYFRSCWSPVWHRSAGFTSEARKCKRHLCDQGPSRNEIHGLLCDRQWDFYPTFTCHGWLHCENGRVLCFLFRAVDWIVSEHQAEEQYSKSKPIIWDYIRSPDFQNLCCMFFDSESYGDKYPSLVSQDSSNSFFF